MLGTTDLLFILLAIIALVWGFNRYRTRFVKTDLLLAAGFAGGLLVFVFAPELFDRAGSVLDIQRRFVVVAVFVNAALLLGLLYTIASIRKLSARLTELNRELSLSDTPQTDGGTQSIFIIIPAYNEGESIRSVLAGIPETIRGYDIQPLVVSDGSADNTAAVAESGQAMVVEHPVNQGQGGALKTGFQVALDRDAFIVVTMDGDGQHSAGELETFVSPIIDGEADYVMGSRFKGTDQSENGIVRQTGIYFFTGLINVLTRSEITDCTNGFRAIRGAELKELTLTEERFSAPELIIQARKNGLRLREVPITVRERTAGETKKPQLMYAVGLTRAIFTAWLR